MHGNGGDGSTQPVDPGTIGDHQLGRHLAAMVTLQSSSSLNPSAIFSQLQDLVGSDTTLLGPLRDLLARPAFRQLIGARPVSLSLGGREALLQELSLVYHPAMLERLAAIIDGVLGLPPGALPSQQNSTLGSLASPAVQDTATPSSNHSSRNAALIGLLAMLAGAGAVASGWFFLHRSAFHSNTNTRSSELPLSGLDRARSSPQARQTGPSPGRDLARVPARTPGTPWGDQTAYKFGVMPNAEYPLSCAFSRSDRSGDHVTDTGRMEFWACRDLGGSELAGYTIRWADGEATTYRFHGAGLGSVTGTRGETHSMRWRNGTYRGDQVIIIDHQDKGESWIPGYVRSENS